MLTVLIPYSKTGGKTEKVAFRLAGMLSDEGYVVSYAEVESPKANPFGYDVVMLVLPLTGNVACEDARRWAAKNFDTLCEVKGAVVTVGDADADAARAAVEGFSDETRWHPDAAVQVDGVPTPHDYDVLAEWFACHIAHSAVAPSVTSGRATQSSLMDLAAIEASLSGEQPKIQRRFGV